MVTFEPDSRMPTAHSHQPSPAPAIWRAIAGAWRHLAQRRAQALRNRRDVQALSQLDDHQLKDIGLTPGQVSSFVAGRSRPCACARSADSMLRVFDTPA